MRFLLSLVGLVLCVSTAAATDYQTFRFDNYNSFGTGGSVTDRLAFYTPLTSTANILTPPRAYPGTAATFSRASAQYITDFEGVVRKVESGSVAVEGSRVVTNLLTYSEDLSNAVWTASGVTKNGNSLTFADTGGMSPYWQQNNVIAGKVGLKTRCSIKMKRVSGTGTIQIYTGYIQPKTVTLTNEYQIFSSDVYTNTDTTPRNITIKRVGGAGVDVISVLWLQFEDVTGRTNTNPGEYVKTTSAAVSKCFSTTNGNTVNGTTGVVTEATGTDLPQSYPERQNSTAYTVGQRIQANGWWYTCTTGGTSHSSAPTWLTGKTGLVTVSDNDVVWTLGGRLLLGYVSEPASTNKTTAYGIIPADTLGSELSSGTLTIGQKYQITSRTDANFVADGAADNVVGTQFVATAATVTLDAGDKVKRVQWGVGEKSFHNGSAFVQNISGFTLSGDVAAVLSIVTDETEIEKAGLGGINPTYKVYKLDNSGGSVLAEAASGGATGNTNPHTISLPSRVSAGTGRIRFSGVSEVNFTNTSYKTNINSNVVPLSTSYVSVRASAASIVYFLLPQLEESVFATSLNPSAGSTSTRAATVLSYPVAGNLTSPLWSAKITATPMAASQDGKFMLGSYYDANNGVGLLMSGANAVARKRLAGSNNDATKALTLVAGTTKRFGLRGSGSGWSLFVDGVKGTDSANTTTPVAGTTLQIGLDGNSGNGFTGYFRDLYLYNKPLTDGRF